MSRLSPYLFYILAGLLVVLLCLPLLISGNWYAGDIIYEFYYNRVYGFNQLKQGEMPLWNPYQFTGYPFLESLQSGLFYPLNFVFLVFKPNIAFILTVVIHLYLAWWFMSVLLENWLGDKWAAFIGGVIFMLCGPLTAHIYAGHITYLNAYPWIPIILHFYRLGFLKSNPLYFIIAGGLSGVQFLTGYPQISLFTFYIVLIFVLYKLFWILKEKEYSKAFNNGLYLVFSGIVVVLISAVQLIPSLLFSRHSGRSGGVKEEFASTFSLPPENTLSLLYPNILGDGVNAFSGTNVAYWGRWLSWEIMPYASVLALLFFVISFTWKDKKIRLLTMFVFLALLCAYGRYGSLYDFAYHYLPGFSMFRVPGRFLVPFAFGLCLLVSYFIAQARDNAVAKEMSGKLIKIALVLLAFSIFLVIMISGNPGDGTSSFWRTLVAFSGQYDTAHLEELPLNDAKFLKGSFDFALNKLFVGIFVLSVCVFVIFVSIKINGSKWFRYGLGLIIIADLLCFSNKYFVGGKDYISTFPKGLLEKVKESPNPRLATKIDTPYLSLGSLFDVPHVGGYDPAQIRIYSEFVNALNGRKADEELVISEPIKPGNLLPLMSVSHVLVQKNMQKYPNAELLGTFEDISLYKLNKTLPRAYFARGFTVIEDKQKRLDSLKENYLLGSRVILNVKPAATFEIEKAEEDGIKWLKDKPHEVSFQLTTTKPRLFVLTDAYYPLWEAYLNGAKLPIYHANHLFRGVVVPEGESTLTFKYNKKPFYLSLALSICGLIVILVTLGLLYFQRGKSK